MSRALSYQISSFPAFEKRLERLVLNHLEHFKVCLQLKSENQSEREEKWIYKNKICELWETTGFGKKLIFKGLHLPHGHSLLF